MLSADQEELLTALNATWPTNHQIKVDGGEVRGPESHPLRAELAAFRSGEACSLPYFVKDSNEIAWFSMAADANELQMTVQDLRAWIIPSLGWQDPRGWVVTSVTATGQLAQLALAISPPGYCRWRSQRQDFNRIADKLRQLRTLNESRPQHLVVRIPSLFEARYQFVTALIAGDRTAAEAAIAVIDRNKLDTADNSLFMRVRCWDRFGETDRIVRGRELDHLTHLRIPHRIRLCVLRAFYETYLREHEDNNDQNAGLESYRNNVHERLAGMIRACRLSDEPFILRLLAYRATAQEDAAAAVELAKSTDDTFVASLLKSLLTQAATEVPIEDQFFEARKRQDWAEVQRLGIELLELGPEYSSILWKSLEYSVNPGLEASLVANRQTLDAAAGIEPLQIPQSWTEWFTNLIDAPDSQFQPFLDNRQKPDLNRVEPSEVTSLHEVLERTFIEAPFETNATVRQLLLSGLPEFMEDFVVDPDYPRDTLAEIYLDLFRLWSALKRGSAYAPDGQVLLNLAEGILQFRPQAEVEVINELRGWWNNRPVKALLPFLLGIVDLLDHIGSGGQCESFWIVGAEFLRLNQQALTPGERTLWRQIGRRIGYDQQLLDEYLPIPATQAEVDPVQQSALGKVAIVSMRERQARDAGKMIAERSGAEIVIVTEKVAGSATESAKTADVILFVWSATSHAVFRAFDGTDRERLAYVQGTGAGSIVLALERWVALRSQQLDD